MISNPNLFYCQKDILDQFDTRIERLIIYSSNIQSCIFILNIAHLNIFSLISIHTWQQIIRPNSKYEIITHQNGQPYQILTQQLLSICICATKNCIVDQKFFFNIKNLINSIPGSNITINSNIKIYISKMILSGTTCHYHKHKPSLKGK